MTKQVNLEHQEGKKNNGKSKNTDSAIEFPSHPEFSKLCLIVELKF